ncbi:MAG TPA: orotidine-5'-phosphate decarboxylase [Acidimicrobiales bacterium]|nr:orotidine-5'-phosphate decarboxylase [Acidimicrobiales bacterium]
MSVNGGPGPEAGTQGAVGANGAGERGAGERGASDAAPGARTTTGTGTKTPEEIRRRLCVALDFDDSVVALRWAARLGSSFGVAKVGLELFSAAGPSVVAGLVDEGFKVFADLKLADIPTTTHKAARVLGALGVSFLTVHASAGVASLRAGVEGLAEGAERAGLPQPMALGVTILTSDIDAPPDLLEARARAAADAGCAGVVCAASDLALVKGTAPWLFTAVAGIRLAGRGTHDQGRAAAPGQAVRAGADLLVIGRAVTEAADPEAALEQIVDEVAAALTS